MEKWLPIPDYEGLYEVSNLGRVCRCGGGRGSVKGRVLTNKNHNGYHYVDLSKGDRKTRFAIHRLVAISFVGPPPFVGAEVNHKNANKTDNRPGNLEWVTRQENNRHAKEMGLLWHPGLKGDKNPRAKLTEEQVGEIKALLGKVSQRELARRYGVARTTIQWIGNGRNWSCIND